MEEVWKDIPNYEGLYQVSNQGRVKSITHYARNNRNGGMRLVSGKILSQYKMPNGYMQVQLSKNEKREKFYIHRIVASVFLENKKGYSDVNHIDGNKNNNCVENLEWCSHRMNQIHMVKNRLTKKLHPVFCVELNRMFNSLSEAERFTGLNRRGISKAIKKGAKYGGYSWELYKNETDCVRNF